MYKCFHQRGSGSLFDRMGRVSLGNPFCLFVWPEYFSALLKVNVTQFAIGRYGFSKRDQGIRSFAIKGNIFLDPALL